MPPVAAGRRIWCTMLVATAAGSPFGCDRFQDTPLRDPPPTEPSPAPPKPQDDLTAGYAEAVASLPEFTAEHGSSWSGLTLEASGIGTRRSETSRPVEEIAARLEALQQTIEEIRLLSERDAVFPDCAASQGASVDDGVPACRVARDAARLLHSDAIRLFARGETEEAAHRIAAGLGIVRQLAEADEMASTNALAIFTLITDPLRPMVEGSAGRQFNALDRGIVRDALDRLNADAPFGASLPAELAQEATDAHAAARELLTAR